MIAGVPYDAEIEYLESTGTQWIDSGVLYSGPCTIRVKAELTPIDEECDLFGAYNQPQVVGNMVCGVYTKFVFLFNQSNPRLDSFYLDENPILLTVECDFADNRRTLIVNGRSYSSNTVSYNSENITIYRGNPTMPVDGIFKCYNFSITRAGVLVRDYIPVRVGTGANAVGYMYDRVSRKLFGNAGTGSFVLGPDVATPVMGLRRYPQSRLGKMGARHMIYGGN